MALLRPPFFRLAKLVDESGQPVFPGMRLVANITFLALELNRWPSEVYKQYLHNPRDIDLVLLYLDYRQKEERNETEKMETERERLKNKYGHLR